MCSQKRAIELQFNAKSPDFWFKVSADKELRVAAAVMENGKNLPAKRLGFTELRVLQDEFPINARSRRKIEGDFDA